MPKTKSTNKSSPAMTLRQRAEQRLTTTLTDVAGMPTEDVQSLVHELQVHQIELEIQNEELRQAQVELAESRDRYSDLYEFAPAGYLTLDRDGKILQANLDCVLECSQPVFVPDAALGTHLYRIAQEAVRNAVRHAQANRIVIRLREDEGTLQLQVTDDGIGIGASADIMIVDDHPAVCEGLGHRISAQPDLTVCGHAADVNDALKMIRDVHPDVVIVDIALKSSDGLD